MAGRAGAVTAGVVLAGGRSSRMGAPKAALEWHGSTLLHRTLGVLARALGGPLLAVRAPGRPLPGLPAQVRIIEDPREGLGPLQGIAVALAALAAGDGEGGRAGDAGARSAGVADVAFVCATDLPFLHPAFVRRVSAALTEDADVALPVTGGYPQPLAAAYRVSLAPLAGDLLTAGQRRLSGLVRHPRCRTLRLDEAALLTDPGLAAADPALDSVVNVNSPEDYHAARARLAPWVTVRRADAPAADRARGPRTVRASTLSGAAGAVGLTPDRQVVAALNGEWISRGDGDVPLVGGDTVVFHRVRAGPGAP